MATMANSTLTVPASAVAVEEIESLVAALLDQQRATDRNNNNAANAYEFASAGFPKQLQRLTSCPSDASVSGRRVNGVCTVLPPSFSAAGGASGIDPQQVRSALALIAAAAAVVPTPTPATIASPSLPDAAIDGLQSPIRQRRPLDRSASEPIPPSASSLAAAAILLDQQSAAGNGLVGLSSAAFCRYKTELCRPFEENGSCKYGDKCQFAHGRAELRPMVRHPKYKTDLCRTYHTTGLCPYGPRCHFIHNDEERRLNEINRVVIEQQRAVVVQAQHQQQQHEVLAAALLTQQRLQQALRQHQQHQQQVEQVIASSLQRSQSLGSGSNRPAKAEMFRNPVTTPVAMLSGISGSVDSGMCSVEAPSSPTSSLATSPTMSSGSSSGSEIEVISGSFQTKQPTTSISDAVLHHRKQHIIAGMTSADAPVPFSLAQAVPDVVPQGLMPPANRHQQKQLSNDAAIAVTLLTRRLRDTTASQTGSDVESTLSQLLVAAAARKSCTSALSVSASLDAASLSALDAIAIPNNTGRCSNDVMASSTVGVSGYPQWQGARCGDTTQL